MEKEKNRVPAMDCRTWLLLVCSAYQICQRQSRGFFFWFWKEIQTDPMVELAGVARRAPYRAKSEEKGIVK